MDTLSTTEARLFKKICDYVWNPDNPMLIVPSDRSTLWKPDFSEEALLESAGLVKFNAVGEFTWGTSDEEADDNTGRPSYFPMTFENDTYFIEVSKGKPVRLRCGKLRFTDVGQEMYRLTTPNYPQSYRDEIVEEWRLAYTVEQFPSPPGF